VWEANRQIFLWPENWLIPEFRENATDLFQALQGTLLQGDITQDLVAQAFTQYLQDLDTRARLDIVSLFNEPPAAGTAATANTLHVLGRHHGKPAKYFYRTYSNGIWNGWIPVTPDIEGDHVLAVIWRGRLNIFWLTFVVQGGPSPSPSSTQPITDGNTSSNKLTNLTLGDLSTLLVSGGGPPTTVQVQLNWSEYYQEKWSPRKSSDINRFAPIPVSPGFDPVTDVYPHASVDTDSNGDEAVRIHLDGPIGQAFRLTSKNCEPACSATYWVPRIYNPYGSSGFDATKDVGCITDPPANAVGAGILQATYLNDLVISNGAFQSANFSSTTSILQTANSFNLLLCNNLPEPTGMGFTLGWIAMYSFLESLGFAPAPASTPQLAAAASSYFMTQMQTLSSPFFYEDTQDPKTSQELTFFVQPAVVEKTISRWHGWAISPSFPASSLSDPKYWNVLSLTPQIPALSQRIPPDLEGTFQYKPNLDAVINAGTQIKYGTSVIGTEGKTSAALDMKTTGGAVLISNAGLDYATALSYSVRAKNQNVASLPSQIH
jgi:hypothetical protein